MWIKGHIRPIWSDDYKNFEYIKQFITDEELLHFKSQGYNHESFTGTMYDSRNIIPSWCNDIAKEIGLNKSAFVFYKMVTGDIMPTHVDHFIKYQKIFKVKKNMISRAILFLEDWKPGHYFEIDGKAICNYAKGDYILWSHDIYHAASNIGIEDRYTLQITGVFHA